MDDAAGAVRTRTEPGLGSQAAVLMVGALIASAAAWIGSWFALLPAAEDADPGGWLSLGLVIVGGLVTLIHLGLLGVFLGARGLVARRGGSPWSAWWALVAAVLPTTAGFALVQMNGWVGVVAAPFVVPLLAVPAMQAALIALALRVRLPRVVSIVLLVLVALFLGWWMLGWLAVGLW